MIDFYDMELQEEDIPKIDIICGAMDKLTGLRCDQKKGHSMNHSTWKKVRYSWMNLSLLELKEDD